MALSSPFLFSLRFRVLFFVEMIIINSSKQHRIINFEIFQIKIKTYIFKMKNKRKTRESTNYYTQLFLNYVMWSRIYLYDRYIYNNNIRLHIHAHIYLFINLIIIIIKKDEWMKNKRKTVNANFELKIKSYSWDVFLLIE